MIDGKNFFDQPVKNDRRAMITSEKLRQVKKMITQPAAYCIMFVSYVKMIAIDFSKPQALDADPKATQQINFT